MKEEDMGVGDLVIWRFQSVALARFDKTAEKVSTSPRDGTSQALQMMVK